jgi:hypothetical protein
MKIYLSALLTALAVLFANPAAAQVVTQLPVAVTSAAVKDFGNGPTELKVLQGNALLFTSQGSGVGSTSGSSTSLTLTAVPATAPCVGCNISGTGLTTQTIAAYNGVTSITLSAVATVAASTALSWGAACPASVGAIPAGPIQAGSGGDYPLYTTARICGASPNGPGASVLPFPIGAH